MKLSVEAERLVELEYARAREEISKKRNQAISQLQRTGPRSGGRKAAIDREYIQMAEDLVQAKLNLYVEAFRRENVIPDESYIAKIVSEFERTVRNRPHNPSHTPLPSSHESYNSIVPRAKRDLMIAIEKMRLERRQPRIQDTEGRNINVTKTGDTYINFGQVGAMGTNAYAHDLTLNQDSS